MNMSSDDFRLLIEQGNVEGVRAALNSDSELANQTIRWTLNQVNESDPLHYVSDCVGNGWLTNGNEEQIAKLLLEYGANINGGRPRETPLLGAVSFGVESVSKVLIQAGADLEATSVFGARALHWSAWLGMRSTVALLIERGAEIDARCSEFGGTPLYWAVHGFGPNGPKQKKDQLGAASRLMKAGAKVETQNRSGQSAMELAMSCESKDMFELLVGSPNRGEESAQK